MEHKAKLIPTKTTLEPGDHDKLGLTSRRRDGNSTRQIDNAVQLLFRGETIRVLDHWEDGQHQNANEFLFRGIMKRLTYEFQLDFKKDIIFDSNRLIISLRKELCG